jgi:multidrug resistance protein MdtO
MATVAQTLPRPFSALTWLRAFLQEELAPYPGRTAMVARMTLSATLIMIIGMTFRIPYTWQGAIYALIVSRENTRATLKSAATMFLVTGIGAIYFLTTVRLVINIPMLHFLWVIGTLFLAFYGVSALTNYTAAVAFINLNALAVPLWDRHVPAEVNVEDTLWLCLAVLVAVVVTGAVELIFLPSRPGDEVILPISDRLLAVTNLLTCYAEGRAVNPATQKQILRLETLGTSLLRRSLRRSNYSSEYSIEMGGVTALVGRLVDLATTLTQLEFEASASDQKRLRNLASALASIRDDLVNRRTPGPLQFNTDEEPAGVPLLPEIEHTVSLIPQAFAASQSIPDYLSLVDDIQRPPLLVSDAFVNPDHLRFAFKGCLAASICYVIYNAMDWPGISTAVTTCLLTALTTIGSSHQKQILRISGAMFGGFVLGMGSQIFILPHLDSIGGFSLLFIGVTALAAWFMTSSPRLSYFGVQIAVAFCLINLSEFKMQTSLEVARDRVVGILLGLFAMWLIFDQLWGVPAARELKETFISNLRLLAQFAREPGSKDLKTATAQRFVLSETINTNLDKARALADGVLLEFGRSREQDLALRNLIRRAQPQMRVLFIMQIAGWKYRVQLPGFELPEAIAREQREFDDRLAESLDAMADRVQGRTTGAQLTLEGAAARFERAIKIYHPEGALASRFGALLVLGRRIESSMVSLADEIRTEQLGSPALY